jgi:hypothetical protein
VPGACSVIWQDPVATPLLPDSDAWHERVPSLTVTVPAGAGSPLPVNWPVTCTAAVTGWPATGFEVVEVIVVEDGAWLTLLLSYSHHGRIRPASRPHSACSQVPHPSASTGSATHLQGTVPYLRKHGEAPSFALRLATAVHG